MTYELLIGQRLYSSWSLRGWLPFIVHDIPVTVHDALIYDPSFAKDVKAFGGETTVPVVKTPDGAVLTDSLSIAWHLAMTFPDRGILPDGAADRARALNMIAKMHAGYFALRGACPMNLATAWAGFEPDSAVKNDVAQIDADFCTALKASSGPFLFGTYGLVDAYYAPVCIRIAGYGLPVSDTTRAYVNAQLSHPALLRWRSEGLARDAELSQYDMPLERAPFPM